VADDDQYFGESGFVDSSDALDESREDTVSAPAYSDSPAPTENEAPKTQIAVDVSDVNWLPPATADEIYSGDAPLAAPQGGELNTGRRSDFFDRNEAGPARTFLRPGEIEAQQRTRLGSEQGFTQGMTVSDLARQASKTLSHKPEVSTSDNTSHGTETLSSIPGKRAYPKMLSLLKNQNPASPEGRATEPAPYVPGTFFPSKPGRVLVPDDGPPDVDGLLNAMADGLLIGEGEDGSSQIMVTLRDDYFRGTELRVSIDQGDISAILMPPDYEVYRHLSSQIHRLEERLQERGLKVTSVVVQKP
jgi:hypothetical protein